MNSTKFGMVLVTLALLSGCGGSAASPGSPVPSGGGLGGDQQRSNHNQPPQPQGQAQPTIAAAATTAPASGPMAGTVGTTAPMLDVSEGLGAPAQDSALPGQQPSRPAAPAPTQPAAAAPPPPPAAAPASQDKSAPGQSVPPPTVAPTAAPSQPPGGGETGDSMFFKNYGTNPFVATGDDKLSTFAMDVDTASYTLMRRYLTDGALPDPNSVRVEEYVNFFDYQYPAPEEGDFAIYTEAAPSPFGGQGYELLQIGIQGRNVSAAQRKPASLTFVIDSSGSMQQENRLETVKKALELLIAEMRPEDTIGIVTYGSEGRVVLEPTSGAEKERILRALNGLTADGSTNAQGGLQVGFEQAERAFGADRINMVLLCSDGVANNGITDPEALLNRNRQYLDKGIQVSTFGFGMGNFNDILMEVLANKGNGSYAYIDSLEEARRVFIENLTGTLQTIAGDAKIQVEFNPQVVSQYRLVGYENRDVADQDFRNDAVDAGEVGAGHSVTALYEIKRISGASGPMANVRIRYLRPGESAAVEEGVTVNTDSIRADVTATTPRFKLASSVAQYAELLRHSAWSREDRLEDVVALAEAGAQGFGNDPDTTEFVSLLKKAVQLAPATRQPPR